jgi:BA14K-like protein
MKFKLFVAATTTLLVMSSASLQAAPLSADLAVSTKPSLSVTEVQYRGRGYGGGYGGGYGYARPYARSYGGGGGWRYRGGAWPWVGLAAGVAAGGIIYNQTYRPRVGYYYDTYDYNGPYYYPTGYSGNPRTICARNFKSFEWNTGMYTTYGGDRRLCPYLQ